MLPEYKAKLNLSDEILVQLEHRPDAHNETTSAPTTHDCTAQTVVGWLDYNWAKYFIA